MHFGQKGDFLRYGRILTLLLLLTAATACNRQTSQAPTETNTSTTVPPETNTPESTPHPSPTATAELTLDGEQILQNAIDALKNMDAYELENSIAGSLGNSLAQCVVTNAPAYFCQSSLVNNSSNNEQPGFMHINNNAWYKNNPEEADWTFIPAGFKTGYSGINDLGLIHQIISATQVTVADTPLYQVEYEVEPELLLQLILQDASQAPEFIAQAETISMEGVSFIDAGTYLPIREYLTISIESETKPLEVTNEIRYNFISPAEIELPLGEKLLQTGNAFFMAISDARLDEAYGYFATEVQTEFSQEAFAEFIETYPEMFAGFESLKLEEYDNTPEITGAAGEFIVLTVQATYSERDPQHFRLIYIKSEDGWHLARFDAVVPKAISSHKTNSSTAVWLL